MINFLTYEITPLEHLRDGLGSITVYSKNLGGRGDITFYLPADYSQYESLPIVILLHGVYGSHWAWADKGRVHLVAEELIKQGEIGPVILAMPSDGLYKLGSFYEAYDHADYEKWVTQDVIAALKEGIPQANDNSKLAISGLSMGGYGALKLGVKYPELFQAFSGMSSITKFDEYKKFVKLGEPEDNTASFIGINQRPDLIDIFTEKKNKGKDISPFIFDCGLDDLLYDGNQIFHQQLLDADIPHCYKTPSGCHEWSYWEKQVREHLVFLGQYIL